MSETVAVIEEVAESTESEERAIAFKIIEREVIIQGSRKALLAGVGAVATLQDGRGEWFNSLVERGEQVEQSGREQVSKLVNKPQQRAKRLRSGVGNQFDKVLAWFNIPTRVDIQELNQKVTELTEKVENLQQSKDATGAEVSVEA